MGVAEFLYTVCLRPRPLRKAANFILKSFLPERVTVEGGVVFLNPEDPVVSGGIVLGVYEKNEMRFFAKHCPSSCVFVDVGANVGVYTAIALAQEGADMTVVCFEPHAESREFLERTVEANGGGGGSKRVIVAGVAVGDACGEANLYANPENKGDNRLYSSELCRMESKTEVVTLDSFLPKRGIDAVDVLKIDVQGYEAKVVDGARHTIERSPKCIIMLEFWPEGLMRSGSDPGYFLRQLREMGFALFVSLGTKWERLTKDDHLLSVATGRVYRNLVGLKGWNDAQLSEFWSL
jgi:FkbM family methyltransferase